LIEGAFSWTRGGGWFAERRGRTSSPSKKRGKVKTKAGVKYMGTPPVSGLGENRYEGKSRPALKNGKEHIGSWALNWGGVSMLVKGKGGAGEKKIVGFTTTGGTAEVLHFGGGF